MFLIKNLQKQHFILLGVWFLINLIQSVFTGLHYDEAYYWMYSQNLDWGFFDHPPLTAFLIHFGYSFFGNELGVRLFMILLSTVTMALILNEIDEKKDLFFAGVFILSFPLVHTHIGGFLALPDLPLVFFTVLFFMVYKQFLQKQNLQLALVLSVIVAAMVYSKYHSFLVIFFVLLSNLKLLKNKYFWVIVIGTFILLLPHIWWQFDNNFPTFRYHLHDRTKPFQLKYVHSNILNQILVAGPLSGIVLFWSLRKFKADNLFKKATIFTIIGFFGTFFILSFWNRIEPHWTASITPLLMFAAYPLISQNQKLKRLFKNLALPLVVLFFFFRMYLAMDFIPNVGYAKLAFYKHKELAAEIKKMAGGKIVGTFNNYALTSTYTFYSGDKAVHLASPEYRFCQYDLWNEEQAAEGDSLFAIYHERANPPELIPLCNGQKIGVTIVPQFQSLKSVLIKIEESNIHNKTLKLTLSINNNSDRTIQLAHSSEPVLGLMQNKKEMVIYPLEELCQLKQLEPNKMCTFNITFDSEKFEKDIPLIIYTRTLEKNRGELISLDLKKLFAKK